MKQKLLGASLSISGVHSPPVSVLTTLSDVNCNCYPFRLLFLVFYFNLFFFFLVILSTTVAKITEGVVVVIQIFAWAPK